MTALLGKPAEQSSYHADLSGCSLEATKAFDGIYLPDGNPEEISLAHTLLETNPWIRVDLVEDHIIAAVNILNRASR
jgi:hypothetical protein